MNWEGTKILVTGAGGFIGSHLTERLVTAGAKTRVFVRYNSRNDWGLLEAMPHSVISEIEVIAGDLRDESAVRAAVQGSEIVFHLGSLIAIPYSYVHPQEVVQTNIMGALNVLNAAREANVKKVVHTSTSEVYGTAQYVPIDEKHPLQGQSPYSASKIGADMLAESYWRSFGTPVAIIRPFNAFGPGQSARAVIPTIISQTLTSGRVRLGSLHPTRDYTYVTDTVEAFIRVAEVEQSTGQAVNIGSNFEVSIGDIAQKIAHIIGKEIEIVTDERRLRPEKSEVARLWCNSAKAREILGWEPKVSFQDGLKNTITWVEKNMARYKTLIYNV